MKKILSILIFLLSVKVYSATPFTFTSDKGVIFATNLVNGETFYSYADAEKHWQELGNISSVTVMVTTFTPTDFELNLSTCLNTDTTKFNNYSDWLSVQTKSGLREKIASLHHKISGYSFDTSSPQYIDMAQRMDWLKSFYKSLP